MKPSSTSSSAASSSAGASGSSVRSSPITSSLTQSVSNASRASCAVRTASRAVKQPAVFGSSRTPARVEHVDERAARGRVDAAQRDGHQLGAARLDRRGHRLERAEAAGAEDQPRVSSRPPIVSLSRRSVSATVIPPGPRAGPRPARPRRARAGPLAARDDLGVDGHGHAAARRPAARARPARSRPSRRRRARSGSPLTSTFTRGTSANRGRVARARPTRAAPRRRARADRSAVTAASRIAVAVVAGRPHEASARRADRPAGCPASPGRSPAPQLLDLELEHAGHDLGEVAEQLVDAARGRPRCPSRAPPSSRRARSGRRRGGRGSRRACGSCASTSPGPRGSRRRRIWPLTGRTGSRRRAAPLHGAGGDDDLPARTRAGARRTPVDPAAASRSRGGARRRRARTPSAQRGDEARAGRRRRRPGRRARAGRSARARARRGAPGSGAAARPRGRARAGTRAGARAPRPRRGRGRRRACPCGAARSRPSLASSAQKRGEAARRARRPSASSASSPNSASVTGASMPAATRHAPASPASSTSVRRPRWRGAPRDGEADDAAADDGDVVVLGLRWHCHVPPYAGISRIRFDRSAAPCRPLSPGGLP